MLRTARAIAILLALSASSALAAADDCPSLTGRWGQGLTRAVAASPGHVFFGRGTLLVVTTTSDPAAAIEVGAVDVGGVVHALAVTGNLVLVAADEAGLVVVDAADPAAMTVLAATGAPGHASGIATDGVRAFVTDMWADLVIFDLSTPAQPTQVGALTVDGFPNAVAVTGHHLLLAEGTIGLRVVDVADPAQPAPVTVLDTPGDATGVTVVGATAYVGDGRAGLRVIDIQDPARPAEQGAVDTPGFATAIAVTGSTAWVADDYGQLRVVDVSNPGSPTEIGFAQTRGTDVAVAAAGGFLWVANWGHGLAVVDGSSPASPGHVAQLTGAGQMYTVAAFGDHAVVGDWSGTAVRVLDLTEPAVPVQVGMVEVDGFPHDAVVSGGRAYVAVGWGPLAIYDLADPTAPALLGSLDTPGNPHGVALAGDHAYVADAEGGLRVIDVSRPGQPIEVGNLDTADWANGVVVADDRAFVAAYSAGLVIADVSNPAAPTALSTLDTDGIALDVAVSGDHAFIAAYASGLQVVDVSDPARPTVAGFVDMSGYARRVEVLGTTAFVANSFEGLVAIDISDPAHPARFGGAATAGEGRDLAVAGDHVLLADDAAGVAVFDVPACTDVGTPPGADFTWSPSRPRAGDPVQLTDLSTGSPTGWSWWFSDDDSRSSEQNPVHTFAIAGNHQVILEVWNDDGSASATRDIVVAPPEGEVPPINYPFPVLAVVPAAAHAAGAEGTAWVTDLVLHNLEDRATTAYLFFMRSDRDNSDAGGVEIAVPAFSSVRLADVVATTFAQDAATGAILVASDDPLMVSSRTYNTASDGTYGQYIPGQPLAEAVRGTATATLIQLEHDARFRTNIGVANPTSDTLVVTVDLFAAAGQSLGQELVSVPPWGHHQANGILAALAGQGLADAYAVLSSTNAQAEYFAYASVVDNTSGDPVYVGPSQTTDGVLWIPASAHVAGANNTSWRTDLEVMAGGATSYTVELLAAGEDNTSPRAATRSVGDATNIRIGDAVDELFAFSGSGALRITPSGGALAATSRTYNDLGDRTFGQLIPSVADADTVAWGVAVHLIQLAYSPEGSSGYRTNLGLVNTTGGPVDLMVDLFAGDGTFLLHLDPTLQPYEFRQVNNIFADATDSALDDAFITVSTTTGEARYLVYASVVDNRSGDPVLVPGRVME